MTKKKHKQRPIVLRVWTAVFGDDRGNNQIIGVEADSLDYALLRFRQIGLAPNPMGVERCLIVGDTEEARKALADWRPVTFADSKEMGT